MYNARLPFCNFSSFCFVEVKFIFNGIQKSGTTLAKFDDSDSGGCATKMIPKEVKEEKIEKASTEIVAKEIANSKGCLVEQKFPEKRISCVDVGNNGVKNEMTSVDMLEKQSSIESLVKQKSHCEEQPSRDDVKLCEIKSNDKKEDVPGEKITVRLEANSGSNGGSKVYPRSTSGKFSKATTSKVEDREKVKTAKDLTELDHRPSKKAKFDSPLKLSEDKNKDNLHTCLVSTGSDAKALSSRVTIAEDKSKSVKDYRERDKGSSRNLKVLEKASELSNIKGLKASSRQSIEEKKIGSCKAEVTRRPKNVSSLICDPFRLEYIMI